MIRLASRIALLSGAIGLIACIPAFAQQTAIPDRPVFSVVLEPGFVKTQGAYVQEQIVLRVQLISPDPFKRLELDLPDVENARSVSIRKPHTRQINSYGGKGYSYETRLALFPEKSGQLIIPDIRISGATEPQDGTSFTFAEHYPAHPLTIHPIDPAFQSDWWLVSNNVVMTQSWSKEIHAVRKGDTIQRKVYLAVHGATAEQLPDLVLTDNAGYRVLGTDVSTKTEKTNDGLITEVQQVWDIYIETTDVIYVSPVQLSYWNSELKTTQVASVPAQRIEPLPQNIAKARRDLRDAAYAAHDARRFGLVVLLAVPAGIVALFLGALVWQALPTRSDRQLNRAIRQNGAPAACYRAVVAWAHQNFGWRITINREQARHLGPPSEGALDALNAALFGSSADSHETKSLIKALTGASRRLRIRNLFATLKSGFKWLAFAR